MARLLTAAILLSLAAAPAFACPWHPETTADAKPATVAQQPADDQGAPPPPAAHKAS